VGAGGSEQGLLGLAFHPDYVNNGTFFVNYTDQRGDTVIGRYRRSSDPNQGDPTSEMVVLRLDQPAANHNGGMLLFGPDGYLWIGMGDGGAAADRFGNGQNPETLLGKMLRLDVNGAEPYAIPPDNPAVADPAVADEIWAQGLRNPWRYSFDRATGELWIADVGQNAYEEINRVAAGTPQGVLNFGWPIMESQHCFREANCASQGLVLPVAEYSHDLGCSVTGGYVYRGQAFPALQGGYLFGDYCSGRIWAIPATTSEPTQPTQVLASRASISSFGEDEAGELYLTDMRGTLYRVTAR
jgi:glucose/arabinose dehydrogenase